MVRPLPLQIAILIIRSASNDLDDIGPHIPAEVREVPMLGKLPEVWDDFGEITNSSKD